LSEPLHGCLGAGIRDGALWIVRNKTKRAIEITEVLAQLIERINARPRERLADSGGRRQAARHLCAKVPVRQGAPSGGCGLPVSEHPGKGRD
jgi:hypothetical protein